MKYLFFDIECCDGVHICSFGYTITDENFKVLGGKDILINPEKPILPGLMKKRAGFTLAYPAERFFASPTFPVLYQKIKALLSAPDTRAIGHAVYNDARFIKTACERYGLPVIDFDFFDTQAYFKQFVKAVSIDGAVEGVDIGLDKMCELLKVRVKDLHRSDADAKMTMLALKKMCKMQKITISQALDTPFTTGGLRFGAVEIDKPRRMLANENFTTNDMSNRNRKLFKRFLERVKAEDGYEKTLLGRKVAISFAYENEKFIQTLKIIQQIYNRGGEYTKEGSEADIFLYKRVGGSRKCVRQAHAVKRSRSGYAVEFYTVAEFLLQLGFSDEDKLNEMEIPVVDLNAKAVRALPKPPKKEVRYKDKQSGFTLGDMAKKEKK